jgi:hypothetical protein
VFLETSIKVSLKIMRFNAYSKEKFTILPLDVFGQNILILFEREVAVTFIFKGRAEQIFASGCVILDWCKQHNESLKVPSQKLLEGCYHELERLDV